MAGFAKKNPQREMFCSTCLDFPEKSSDTSSFVSGCSNFRMESLRSHVKSTGHIRAEEAIRVKANARNTPLPGALLLVSEEVRLKVEKLFDIAYMIARLELPFTTFPRLCALEKKHGVCLGNTYQTDKACKNFVLAITDELKCNISETVKLARFIRVMADGVTDVGTREVEDVYVRFLENGVPL